MAMKQCKYIGTDFELIKLLENCYYEIEESVPVGYEHMIYINNLPAYYLDKKVFDDNFIDIRELRQQKIKQLNKL